MTLLVVPQRIIDKYICAYYCGVITKYGGYGLNFEYSIIPYSRSPLEFEEDKASLLLTPGISGKANKFFIFVARDRIPNVIIPERYIDYLAAHEFGEQTFGSHLSAFMLELAIAKMDGELEGYLNWMEKMFPARFKKISMRLNGAINDDD